MDVKIAIKDFIPKDLKPVVKKRIQDAILQVSLVEQIAGEEIPSVLNEKYHCQVIQFYDIEVHDIKDAPFIGSTYQGIIKSLCVLRIHDPVKEVYSLALKRLSQVEENKMVLTDSQYTEAYPVVLPDSKKNGFIKQMSYGNILNKTNKVNYYFEMYSRAFILQHKKIYSDIEELLNKPIWYDSNKVWSIYSLLRALVEEKDKLNKVNTNADKVKINREIIELLNRLKTEIK